MVPGKDTRLPGRPDSIGLGPDLVAGVAGGRAWWLRRWGL